MIGRFIIAVVSLAGVVIVNAADKEITKLNIEEEAGAARHNEPITMGIPLPEGVIKDVNTLVLKDAAGKVIPCQFFEVSKWHTDKGGIKWVHANFQASVAAKGKEDVILFDSGAVVTPAATPLKATVEGNVATVVTGPVKFSVRGANFNGFNGVWFDPSGKGVFGDSTLIVPASGVGGSLASADGKNAFSAKDADGKVELERSGPMAVVIKATGSHKDESGAKVFDYTVRFHAYANSPVVRVTHTFVNRQGKGAADRLLMTDLAFEVPTSMAKPAVEIGTDAKSWTGSADKDPVYGIQKSDDEFAVMAGSDEKVKGKGKSVKPLTVGWIDVGTGKKHVACGVRWFWQMWPKAVVAKPDGTLRIGLYPAEHKSDFEVFMGQSRTHDLTFLFHDGSKQAELNEFFTGSQRPLRAFASPKYYCRDSKAFGPIADSDQALFGGDWPKVQEHDKVMLQSIQGILKNLDGEQRNGRVMSSYGFYPWGDSYHYSWGSKDKSPNDRPEWTYSWEGNYYDFPNACLLQFARTGEKKFLERFEMNARHVGDVYTCQWHPEERLRGACRYCPPRNHVATDDGAPYVSVEFNHAKSQCVFNNYYLYGDLRSLDNAMLLANNALKNHEADKKWAARGFGHLLTQIMCAYDLTGEAQYLDRIKQEFKYGIDQAKSGKYSKGDKFMWGIADEGLVYAYWLTKDQVIVDALKSGYQERTKDSYLCGNMALGAAFVNAMTDDAACKEFAWKNIAKPCQGGKAGPIMRPKDYGMAWRNVPFALYYLSDAYGQDKKAAGGQ
ncbi:MAG: hypothetical protein C0404_06640 [Verrucomicrobia bacterium]|nr:hypothetical protein [Verrucomicrobiota bacterium]